MHKDTIVIRQIRLTCAIFLTCFGKYPTDPAPFKPGLGATALAKGGLTALVCCLPNFKKCDPLAEVNDSSQGGAFLKVHRSQPLVCILRGDGCIRCTFAASAGNV
jgi:hypothetical protein